MSDRVVSTSVSIGYRISAFPYIDPADYMRRERINDPLMSKRGFFLYSSGRAALYHAILTAGFPKNSRILVPSFHCGVEVEAVHRAGYQADFYNIMKDLNIDFEDLVSRVRGNTRALIVTHYFGFPQDMERVLRLCQETNLVLFEDCAHALYSSIHGRWVGTFGEFGIFSIRKTVALPNGGGLLCNSPRFPAPPPGRKSQDYQLFRSTAKSMVEYTSSRSSLSGKISRWVLSLYGTIHGNAVKDVTRTMTQCQHWFYDAPSCDYNNTISKLSLPLVRKGNIEYIINTRRKNYSIINEKLTGLYESMILESDIKDGICPLCYVVSVDDRETILAEMRRKGIYPFVFGASPHASMTASDYPDIDFLSGQLMGLPVHQQLAENDIMRVTNIFMEIISRRWRKRSANRP